MKTETITVGSHSEYPLSGTLTLPDNLNHPVPAVVLVHGSGASDQDEKVGKLKPFRDLSEGLAVNGIASLRYDKRTFVHARKMMKQGQITIYDETIEDAVKAADNLFGDLVSPGLWKDKRNAPCPDYGFSIISSNRGLVRSVIPGCDSDQGLPAGS